MAERKAPEIMAFIMANKEILAILAAVLGFTFAVGQALTLARQGLDTAHEVNRVVQGEPGQPGLAEKAREHARVLDGIAKIILMVEAHEQRIVRIEETRYTTADAAKDRELLRAGLDSLRADIQSSKLAVVDASRAIGERLSRVEAKLEGGK